MQKFAAALVLVIVLAILVLCIAIWTGSNSAANGNATAEAIRIALADPGVQGAINDSWGKACTVDNVSSYGADGRSGLAGTNETLLKVALIFGTAWSAGENRGIVVDATNGTIVGMEQYFRRLGMPPYTDSIAVPPGATWYRRINAGNVAGVMPTITFEPADAKVYATIVDGGNLSLFLNGSAYSPLQFLDLDTNATSTCENRLIGSPWAINLSVPWSLYNGPTLPGGSFPAYYVILKNDDPQRFVEMTYSMRM